MFSSVSFTNPFKPFFETADELSPKILHTLTGTDAPVADPVSGDVLVYEDGNWVPRPGTASNGRELTPEDVRRATTRLREQARDIDPSHISQENLRLLDIENLSGGHRRSTQLFHENCYPGDMRLYDGQLSIYDGQNWISALDHDVPEIVNDTLELLLEATTDLKTEAERSKEIRRLLNPDIIEDMDNIEGLI